MHHDQKEPPQQEEQQERLDEKDEVISIAKNKNEKASFPKMNDKETTMATQNSFPPPLAPPQRTTTTTATSSASSPAPLMQLFIPPPPPSKKLERDVTEKHSNYSSSSMRDYNSSSLRNNSNNGNSNNESSPLLLPLNDNGYHQNDITTTTKETLLPLNDLFSKPPLPPTSTDRHKSSSSKKSKSKKTKKAKNKKQPLSKLTTFCTPKEIYTTLLGSFTFVLYDIVFCLAMSSGIHRPSSHPTKQILLGPITKIGALGAMTTAPTLIYLLGGDLPALYPCIDLFLAPFLSELAVLVDDTLSSYSFQNQQEEDAIFLSTFIFLNSLGLALTAILNICASKFKFANLAGYLPYNVLAGFFSNVGLTLWTLAFQVDMNGKTLGTILLHHEESGKTWDEVLKEVALHHVPSLIVGCIMFGYGPNHPLMTPLLVVVTIVGSYALIWFFGLTLADARDEHWFWLEEDFIYNSGEHDSEGGIGNAWVPPMPFGVLGGIFSAKVNFHAVLRGLPTACAMAVVYMLRCSLHAPAIKKNAGRLVKKNDGESSSSDVNNATSKTMAIDTDSTPRINSRKSSKESLSSMVKDDNSSYSSSSEPPSSPLIFPSPLPPKKQFIRTISSANQSNPNHEITPTKSNRTTTTKNTKKTQNIHIVQIMFYYGIGLLVPSIVGGFAALPAIAAGATLFNLGADGIAPQYGSNLCLLLFYLTDFKAVSYVPKPAFSCLLIVAFLDLMINWFVKSYTKTKNKIEWLLVVPTIMICPFVIGILESVALGVAMSTFIFVPALFQSGIVKFNSTGRTLRSTIERSSRDALWLDQNGDLMQVLVLQNYLFFGNASSLCNYVSTMFEESPIPNNKNKNDEENHYYGDSRKMYYIPPMPKYIIIDMTIVTGMDTSAVDVFAEIASLCEANRCMLYFAGLSPTLKSFLNFGGVVPSSPGGANRHVRFLPDLETALGKAEDALLKNVLNIEERDIKFGRVRRRERMMSDADDGFYHALSQIDEQHNADFAPGLEAFRPYTQVVELEPGQCLFESSGGLVDESERGLFFIEYGLMKVERDSSYSTTRSGSFGSLRRRLGPVDGGSIGHLNARAPRAGQKYDMLKEASSASRDAHSFRLARFGPGWVVGAIEGASGGMRNPGVHIAVTPCRLHHLPYINIEKVEAENPALVLHLFKMMSLLSARRQEVTIDQLATLHSIMNSPPLTKPISRATMGALLNA